MLELYHAQHSTCSQRVRLCLFEKNLEWTSHPVVLERGEQLRPEYLRLNPNGVVPTLVHDGHVVTESSVIVEYLDDVFPDPPLAPRDHHGKARLRAWLHYFDEVAAASIRFPSLHAGYLAHQSQDERQALMAVNEQRPVRKFVFRKIGSAGFSDEDLTAALDALRQTVERIDGAVAASRAWIAGPDLSLAETLVTPTIDRMHDLGMEEIWADLPHFLGWWQRMQSRRSFALTYAEQARLSSRIPEIKRHAREMLDGLLQRTGRTNLRG